jgi:hypothetical protein
MKRTLDNCMRLNKQLTDAQCKKLALDYEATLSAAYAIYDKHLFRLFDKENELNGRRSVPLADAILLAVAQNKRSWDVLIQRKPAVIRKTKDALKNGKTYEILVGRGNTKTAIEERIDVVNSFLGQVASK